MKKIIIFIIIVFGLTGCVNIKKDDISSLVDKIVSSKIRLSNEYRTGYKYYLPTNMNVTYSGLMNETINDGKYNYYLYVDLVSFFNSEKASYVKHENSFFSKEITFDNKTGYLEIFTKNNKYLIEIIYNYAKIEVIVDKEFINEAVSNSLIVLSSIEYNKSIIDNLIGDNILSYSEEKFTIFDDKTRNSNFLEYVQEFDNYDSNDIPDYDLIN